MLQTLKRNKNKIITSFGVSLLASGLLLFPSSVQAKEEPEFRISAEWINSPTIDGNGYSSKTDYNWVANTEETRSVSMALEYYFNNSVNSSGFPSESIEIHVPGLAESYRTTPLEGIVSLPEYWDYDYNKTNDEYIIYNTEDINVLTGFAGEFSITYNMNSRELVTGSSAAIEPYAVVNNETIDTEHALTFDFSSIKDRYTIQASVKTVGDTSSIPGAEGLNVIRYEIIESTQNASRGTYDKYYLVSDLDDGIVLGYSDGENINTDVSIDANTCQIPYAATRQIYIGYPKSKSNEASHTFELFGYYYDEDALENLSSDNTTVDFKNFDFTYSGELYMIGNTGYNTKPDESRISLQELQNGRTLTYSLRAVAIYSKPPALAAKTDMDVWIIDDFIYAQGQSGNYRELDGNEYDIKSITIPSNKAFTNDEGLAFAAGKYEAEILINTFDRNAAAYKTVIIDKTEHTIELPEGTDRVMIRIQGLTESLYLEHGNMWMEIEYHLDKNGDFLPGGYLRNLDSIWVDWCDNEHHNTVDPTVSYPGDDDDVIKNRDIDAYGVYMQRNYFDYYYISRNIQGLLLMTQETDDVYDPDSRTDGFIVTEKGYESYVGFTSVFTNATSGAKEWAVYTILPDGMELNHDESVVFDIAVPSGLSLTKENLKIKETKNYKNSGRTYLSITYDFSDQLIAKPSGTILASVEIPVRVSFQAAAKNTAYPVWGISMMKNPNSDVAPTTILESAYPGQAKGGTDDGSAIAADGTAENKLWKDIDKDGSTKDMFVYNNIMLNITDLAAVNMEVISYVRNSTSDFIPNIDQDHKITEVKVEPEEVYVYRLNAVNTGSAAKNVVFYDVIENAELDGDKGNWKGKFNRVDTSVLEAYGLNPKVYYCYAEYPTLDYTDGDWSHLPPTLDTNPTAIAVVADIDGNDFILSDNIFIDIYMKAPSVNEVDESNLHGTHTLNQYTLKYDALTGKKSLNSNITGVTIYEKGQIEIIKKDKDTDDLLSGAKFKLVDAADTSKVIATCVTNSIGEAVIKDIPFGEYILMETEAPENYQIDDTNSYPIYLGNNETKKGADGKNHEFVKKAEITIYNKVLEDRSLTITKTIVDSNGADIFGEVSFLYRVEGKSYNGQKQVWNVIITPENGYGSKTIENMPIPDENGYKVTELTSSRYQLVSILGRNIKVTNSGQPAVDLNKKSIIIDLAEHKDGQADYTNKISRWDKFGWSSAIINKIKK